MNLCIKFIRTPVILWQCVAEEKHCYFVHYYAVKNKQLQYRVIPRSTARFTVTGRQSEDLAIKCKAVRHHARYSTSASAAVTRIL